MTMMQLLALVVARAGAPALGGNRCFPHTVPDDYWRRYGRRRNKRAKYAPRFRGQA